MDQFIQIVGSLLIVSAFGLAQSGRLTQQSAAYLLGNLIGAILLGWEAAVGGQYGFLLMETVWGGVSVVSLAKLMRRSRTGAPAPVAEVRTQASG